MAKEHLERATMRPQASHSSHQTDTRRAAPRRASLRAILLATSALASAAVPITVAHADPVDATWLAAPADGNFNNAANWSGTAIPDGTATFNASTQQTIAFTQTTTLSGMTLTPSAGNYTFTNNSDLTFTGSGIVLQDGASATLTNSASGTLKFHNNASAGAATITNFSNTFEFHDHASAANATIFNHGELSFIDFSTAGNAVIESDGLILFNGQTSGGTASIKLGSGGGLDISHLDDGETAVGSIQSIDGSGIVSLGGKTLSVGGNNSSTVFAGVIQDGGLNGGAGGSLTKEGTGALTLTGINTYTGATTVNGGTLVVDGSIATSSGVTVNAGGTLAGLGTVATTAVNGGTLAPGHSDSAERFLIVQGNLSFTAAATYLVQFSPSNSTSTLVTKTAAGTGGTATLGGATVAANFTPGTYVTKEYTILSAASIVTGTFRSLVSTNLSPMFKASLSYDRNNVFLDLSANPVGGGGGGGGSGGGGSSFAGFNGNQNNVGNGIANSLNLMNGIPGAFVTLTPAGFTQVSGETAVGTQQATFDAMNQFMGVMLDPTVGALSGGRAFAQANASMARKAPEAFDARWGVWAAGFGGSQSVSGDTTLGSNKTTSNVFGSAAGAEYRFSPNTVAGFALAGGGTNFSVANGGSGSSDLFQAGAYLRHTQGAAFLAAALAYGWQDVTTNRTVTVNGIDSLRGRFNANAVSGRLEGGYKVATAAGDITPYAAGQFISYHLPSYAEQVAFGANTFALSYNGKDVTATRTELGLRSEKAVALTDATLMLRGRLAWAHDFNTDRNVQATFLTLPGSAFVVNGAQPAADTALTTVSAEMLWRNGWSASATADAQLSDTTHSYSGKGVVRYNW
jgi:autotransporter-associated beta strand protein